MSVSISRRNTHDAGVVHEVVEAVVTEDRPELLRDRATALEIADVGLYDLSGVFRRLVHRVKGGRLLGVAARGDDEVAAVAEKLSGELEPDATRGTAKKGELRAA